MMNGMLKPFQILHLYFSALIPKKRNRLIFGSWFGERFADNSKAVYLTALTRSDLECAWITRNENVYEELAQQGLPVYMDNDPRGKLFQIRANLMFVSTGINDVSQYCTGGCTIINLWHGVALKKIVEDNEYADTGFRWKLHKLLWRWPHKRTYVLSTSDVYRNIYARAFDLPIEQILKFGLPRNDIFFGASERRIGDEIDISEKKLIIYLPTHRNEGAKTIDLRKVLDLDVLNRVCREHNAMFVVKKHFYHRGEGVIEGYSNILDVTNSDIDTQDLLLAADVLVTDYSSCYIDFLLRNKPILLYSYDYDEYLAEDRQMYFDFNRVNPGPRIDDFDALVQFLNTALEEGDRAFSERREEVTSIFFDEDARMPASDTILDTALELAGAKSCLR